MVNLQQTATGMQPQTDAQNWTGEISYQAPQRTMQRPPQEMTPVPGMPPAAQNRELEFNTGLPDDAVQNPVTAQEAYAGSMKGLLAKNVGHYIVATFLVGTQNPVSWEGFLHSVGNDYLVIFQPDMGRYITGDFYSLKFVEFHDTKGVIPTCAGYRRRDGQRIW